MGAVFIASVDWHSSARVSSTHERMWTVRGLGVKRGTYRGFDERLYRGRMANKNLGFHQ
jgi:hypothetical protein